MNAPLNGFVQDLTVEPIDDDVAQAMREEIAQVAVVSDDTRDEGSGLAQWFMGKSLRAKAKIASAFSLGSMLVVSMMALIGFSSPALMPTMRVLILVVAATGLLLGFASLQFILKRIIAPFNQLSDGMTRLSGGARDITVSGTHRRDELGDMARALEVFVKSGHKLDELFKGRKAAEEDRLRRQDEQLIEAETVRRATVDRMAREFEASISNVVGGVAAASGQLQETATAMAIAAEQASTQTGLVAKSMEQAHVGVTSAATASDEFAMSISEISRQATQSAELARKANDAAGNADETISALSDSAGQVGQIVELIQSIAQKTNLLALNASIEAARGGEAGRGFAVVASEVKELANQTSRATEDVAEQIKAIQGSTGASVTALRSIVGQIEQLESTAISIASAVDQQSVAGRDLAKNIDIAARATDEVSSSVEQVRETSIANGAAASQVLSSASELEHQASSLRRQVDDFLAKIRAG